MIPDAQRRLGEAINDLFTFMEDHHANEDVLKCEAADDARALLLEYDNLVTD